MKRLHANLTYFLEGLICISFLSLFVMVILLVGLRYIFNSSISGANEIITILFIYTTSIGSAIAVGQRSHISINILEDKLSQGSAKYLAKLQLALVGLINFIIAWFSLTWISQTGDNLMPTLGAARSVVQISIPLGCGLAALYCITSAIVGLDKIKDGDLNQANSNFSSRDQDHSK
ncbi:MAG: TRAP transporter small permease [Verrucomicrobiota bacterium]|nr:TRAP transporter small permease [Verrucomicrobiota bacterium]